MGLESSVVEACKDIGREDSRLSKEEKKKKNRQENGDNVLFKIEKSLRFEHVGETNLANLPSHMTGK